MNRFGSIEFAHWASLSKI